MTEPLRVRLLGVPLDVQARSSAHVDALQREFELIALADQSGNQVPHRLRELIAELRVRFGGMGEGPARTLAEARANHETRVDLVYEVPEGVGEAAGQLLTLLAEADAYCRSGDLITLATPAELVRFRQWFLGEFVRQSGGEAPRPWPLVVAADPAGAPDGTSVPAHGQTGTGEPTPTSVSAGDGGPGGGPHHDVGDGFGPEADSEDMSVSVTGQEARIRVGGDLDLLSAPRLRELIAAATDDGIDVLELDLSDVSFLDSVGMSVLLSVRLRMEEEGVAVRVSASDQVGRVFALAGVSHLFPS